MKKNLGKKYIIAFPVHNLIFSRLSHSLSFSLQNKISAITSHNFLLN